LPGYLLRRLAASALLLWLVLTTTFLLLRVVPGSPVGVLLELPIPRQQKAILIHAYGLDRPLPEQYLRWLGAVVLHGDWGISFAQLRPVGSVVAEALPATLLLAGAALLIEYGAGVALGVAAARRSGSGLDRAIRLTSLALYSQPVFWLGLMAILLFSHWLRWLPPSHLHSVGADEMARGARLADLGWHLVLPAVTLGLGAAGGAARFVRASLLEVMGRDFIRTARAKGLSERRVVWVHGGRAVLVPLIQLLAISVPNLLSGALVTEIVFSWPGLGRITLDAILTRDSPVLLATTAIAATLVIGGNLVADLLQAAVDPRVRDA
jgi:ABC-type dipeptide/oligopeptide/nickel transport system permease component